MTERALSLLVHGPPGSGKSWLADSMPGPRLILDAEGGSRFTPSRKIKWDGMSAPPTADGTWDTCVVTIRNFNQMKVVFQWLNSGQHPFESVGLDSLTEIQKRCLDEVSGVNQPTQQDWGSLLRSMESLVRQFRDLTMHATKPVTSVVLICLTSTKDGTAKPHVQGQLAVTLSGFVDVVGYLYVQTGEDGQPQRRMLVQPIGGFEAKDRTNRLGTTVEDPNMERMLAQIFDAPASSQAAPAATNGAVPGVDPAMLAAYQAYQAQLQAAAVAPNPGQ